MCHKRQGEGGEPYDRAAAHTEEGEGRRLSCTQRRVWEEHKVWEQRERNAFCLEFQTGILAASLVPGG